MADKARPWPGFHFTVQKRPVPGSSGALLAGRPHLESSTEIHPGGKKSASGSVSASSADARRKEGHGYWCSWCITVLSLLIILIFGLPGCYAFPFFDQWRSITSNRFVFNMVQGHHLQLRSCPPLFHNFQQFSTKVVAGHHPIIQKEVDELLSKEEIEPPSGGAGFCSRVSVVAICTGGLWSILNLKQFNCYMHIPSFQMPTIRHILQLIQHGYYAFSIDLQDAYLHIPNVKLHHYFLQFGTICHISGRFYLLVWPQPLGFSQASLNLSCPFAIARVSILLSICLTNLVLVQSKWAGKRAHSFLCSLLVCLTLHINFSKSNLYLTQTFCFLGLCWDTVHMSVSLPPDELADIQ